jgi:hypothetical protein
MNKLVVGLALMVAGFLAFAHEGLSFIAQQPRLAATVEQGNPLPLSPAFGAVAMFAGFVLIALQKDHRVHSRT